MQTLASYGAVLLSMGDRTAELDRALTTLLAQRDVLLDVVVVGNGWAPTGLPEGVRAITLPGNVGVPEGRNIGAAACSGDLLLFYDDDAELPDPDSLAQLAAALHDDPQAAIAQPRAVDPTGLPSPRRWVPRLRVGDQERGGVVAGVWEGVFVIRRAAFEQAGGWPGLFFYAHEGIELVWRLFDAGWHVRYVPAVRVHHPATSPTRHSVYYRMNARNRVWVARRNLPLALAVPYVLIWIALTVLRVHKPEALRVWGFGLLEGLRTACGPRRPIGWMTALRLSRAGRPPIV